MSDADRPRLIVVAGPNGSGKTSVTEQLLRHTWMDGCVYVNPDLIARDEFGDWNSPAAVLAAANRAAEIREKCVVEKRSLAFETVLSAPDKVEFIVRAKSAGFFVRLFFVCTDDPTINAKRIAQRVIEGGHDVPIPKIVSRYTRSIVYCAKAARLADRTYLYDNTEDDVPAKLVIRFTDGHPEKTYGPLPGWAQEITREIAPK